MKVAFIARSTLFKVHGGITVQVIETARHLRELGVDVVVYKADEKISYEDYDLLHFFDITRPANILYHIRKSKKPFVISPILIDYSEFDKYHRKGLSGFIFRMFPARTNEYIKTVLRWILGKDKLQSKDYLWRGQARSMRFILQRAEMILPNSRKEYNEMVKVFTIANSYTIVPNGIDEKLFSPYESGVKEKNLVVCAARIEGLKNQLNLVKALNNTEFNVLIIGDAAPNQKNYYRYCRKIAAGNIKFIDRVQQEELLDYYKKAKVHILPSWFETCGLSSLEAAAMGCNIVVTKKGFTREYFGEEAFYCDPENIESIYAAVQKASGTPPQKNLQAKVFNEYTWQKAAAQTLKAYKKVLPGIETHIPVPVLKAI
jgi:glycosyltransferase involved in cell wall biosynthesis